MKQRKAAFLDLFGTLIEDHGVLEKPDDIVFKAGAIDALKKLQDHGFLIFVSICRLGMPIPDRSYIETIQQYVSDVLLPRGVEGESIHFISHVDSQHIDLHPLTPDVIQQLQREHNLKLPCSAIIGDLMHDVKIGKETGVETVLLNSTADSPLIDDTDWVEPDIVVENLAEAADKLARRHK